MLDTTFPRSSHIQSLSLVFLLGGLLGCSHGSQGEQQAAGAKSPAPAAPAAASASAPAASVAAAPASAAAPTPPAAAGAAGGTAPQAAPGAGRPAGAPAQAAPPQPLPPDKIPAVVAKVNGSPINKGELLKTAEQVHSQMMPNAPETAEFYRRVLDNLVARELLLQEVQEELKKEGMTEAELAQKARDAFLMQKLVESKVINGVTVSDADIKAFYDKNQEQMKRPERVHLRHVLIKVAKGASAEDKQKAKAKADDVLAKAKAGADFAKLATESSDDPGSKARGGDLSWVSRGQTVPPFEAAAFALKKPNDLSPVVETDFGYHVIQLLAHEDAGVVPLAEVKDKIAEFLKQKQQQEKVQDHIKALRAKGKVEVFI